jgi:hypothetical protein
MLRPTAGTSMALAAPPRTAKVDTAAQALFEEARRRRQRRHRCWGASLLMVVLLTSIISSLWPGGGASPRSGQRLATSAVPANSPTPAEMVVWTTNFRIEVISAVSGHVIRTLATNVALYRYMPHPTVSPSGTVFFDNAHYMNGRPSEQVLSVPLSGGPVTVIGAGHYPVVSPNGLLLAYLAFTDVTGAAEAIVVRNLRTGVTSTWRYSGAGPDISQLSWAPDSTALSFTTTTTTAAGRGTTILAAVTLDLSDPGRSLEGARRIPLPAGLAWAGYVNATEGIGVRQRPGSAADTGWTGPAIVDVATGRIVRGWPEMPGLLGVWNVHDGLEGTVQVDPSGRHLALAEVGSGRGSLWRWTIGSRSPARITTGVGTAAWVPVAAPG